MHCLVLLQNAVVFQAYGAAARYLTGSSGSGDSSSPAAQLSLSQVFLAGCWAGVVQTVGKTSAPVAYS
jgi:hypothetical protein